MGWLQGWGTGSGKGKMPRSGTQLCLLSPNLLGLGRFSHGPTSPAKRWGPAQRRTPSLCAFWGLLGLGISLPTAAGKARQAAGDGVTVGTIGDAGGRSLAEGRSPRAWAGFAENVTLVRNCET